MKDQSKMAHVYRILLAGILLCTVLPTVAQITVDDVGEKEKEVTFKDKLKSTAVDVDYFSLARYRAERAQIRKDRNYLEMGGGIQGSLSSYNDPWIKVSGGDNAIALVATFNLYHLFTKNLFVLENRFSGKFGYNRMKVETTNANGQSESNGVWFKNQDEFALSIAPGFKMSKNWSYGATFKFRSQFVNGYKSRTEQKHKDLKSTFMTPGYLDISFGITYKSPKPKFPIVVNFAPIALSATYANSDWIRKQQLDADGKQIKPAYTYGIEDPDKTSKYEGGSSVQIDFDRKFGKNEYLRYRTTLFSFYGWITDIDQKNKINNYSKFVIAYKNWADASNTSVSHDIKDKPRLPIHPIVRWENTLDIRAGKFLTTSINFQLYYNRAQNVDVQTRTLLSVGLTYTFKNKAKAQQ